MRSNLAYSAYSQNNVSIESSEKLIKMLYEGILKFASQAKRSIELEDTEKKYIGLIEQQLYFQNYLTL